MKYRVNRNVLPADHVEFFDKLNKGYRATRDTLTIEHEDGAATEYIIFVGGRFTNESQCRDIGKFYEVCEYGHIYRFEKEKRRKK